MTIIVDASLAYKWFVEESGSDAAYAVLVQHIGQILVPDTFLVEVSAALVRDANMQKQSAIGRRKSLERFLGLVDDQSIRSVRIDTAQLAAAANLAIGLGHPLKDCIYLALAMDLGCALLTCDARFAAKARGVWADVRVLGDARAD